MQQGGRLGVDHANDALRRHAFLTATPSKRLPVRCLPSSARWQAEQRLLAVATTRHGAYGARGDISAVQLT
jgi:hypothetical protein